MSELTYHGARHEFYGISVYGLFDDGGACLYVGASTNPKARAYALARERIRNRRLNLRIIRKGLIPAKAARIEEQVIRAYWRKEQANYNIVAGHYKRHRTSGEPKVKVNETGESFVSGPAVARWMGIEPKRITRALRLGCPEWSPNHGCEFTFSKI